MPSLQKFHANVSRHMKLMDKNLCANLIRHDYIVTGRTKAKRAQRNIESFLSDAIKELRTLKNSGADIQTASIEAFNYLQPPDRYEIGSKIVNELQQRYPSRSHGFTRIIKLEPRLGEDKAPMSVIELVDSEYEIKFWYIAKTVARYELQALEVDELTQHNVRKLTNLRPQGKEQFAQAVETAKIEFFKYDPESGQITDDNVKQNLKNLPRNQNNTGSLLKSKKFLTKPRAKQESIEYPKSPFLS